MRGATTGVVGGTWRATVTGSGDVHPWDGSPALRWLVAADDRWHDPAVDSGVRQRRVAGTPVIETRVRIPGGDAVHRVWSVADAGGVTVVKVANESPAAIAVALTRDDLLTSRAPTTLDRVGVDLPSRSIVLPIAHRTAVTVGLSHRASPVPAPLPTTLADAEAVVRGWVVRSDAASRLVLPEEATIDAVRAARCELLLGQPPDHRNDPQGFLLSLVELWRMGELTAGDAAAASPDVAGAAASLRSPGPLTTAALDAAAVLLAAADETRAVADVGRIRARLCGERPPIADAVAGTSIEVVAAVERRLAADGALFPNGLPRTWNRVDLEAHGLLVGPRSRLSLALRWHAAGPVVLWHVDGDRVALTSPLAPGWRTTAGDGEVLWQNLDIQE